jgi:hypothetical protein
MELRGIDTTILFNKVLEAIDQGITTEEIRQNPLKYIVSGKTQKIVVNTGGEGLKVSYEIIEEMAKRGDQLAKILLENNEFNKINENSDWGDTPHSPPLKIRI